MSTVLSTDPNVERTEGNQFIACKNPYLKTSDWGCIDIVSAGTGEMKKRYGLVFVGRYDGTGDFSRRKKKSFSWYKEVIESNGEKL